MAELKKTLGIGMIAAIAFVSLIYPDIIYNVGVGVGKAGVGSVIAWIILAVASVFTAMYIGELIGMFPSAGGIYEFYKQAFGRFPSFLVGWVTWIAGNMFTALYSVAAVEYLVPPGFSLDIGSMVLHTAALKIIVTVLFIVFMNIIAFRGIEASARVMLFLAVVAMVLSLALIFPGVLFVHASNFLPFVVGGGGLLVALFFLSETFFGWDSVASLAEETKDAERVIPRVLVAVTAIVAAITLLTVFVTIGVLGTHNPASISGDGFLAALGSPQWLLVLMNVSIFLLIFGSTVGNVIGLPRLLLALGRDKLFIEQFSDVHEKYQSPYKAIIFQTIVASAFVVFGQGEWDRLFRFFVPLNLCIYAGLLLLVPYFRWKRPQQPRAYRAPFARLMPFVIAALYLLIFVTWASTDPNALSDIRWLFAFIFFSIPIYALLMYFYDPDSLIGTMNLFSRANLFLEDVLVPKRLRREIVDAIKNVENKHILEFGSGVGSLTVHLAEKVGKGGKVYAIGLSASDVRLLQRRLDRLGHTHVEVIHDPHLVNRVHPSVKSVDIIVSVGHLSYIQDVKKVLREMSGILPERGNIYFVEYVDFFFFLPNPKWLSDPDTIKETFADAGFNVTVRTRRGIFWKYLYIYGVKESRRVPFI